MPAVSIEQLQPKRQNIEKIIEFQESKQLQNGTQGNSGASKSPILVGKGLVNMGNTCFLNSVLQCLAYVPLLSNYFTQGKHASSCRKMNGCIACIMERQIVKLRSFSEHSHGAIRPVEIVSNLKRIAPRMRVGRQEDAHEFLRFLIDGIHSSTKSGQKSFVYNIFRGTLQSSITCFKCRKTSNTTEPLLDLSLEVRRCTSVEQALHRFTAPETLNRENKYKCENCKELQNAQKRMLIAEAPKCLTIHLKRFDFFRTHSKITQHILFKETLDLGPFTIDGGNNNYHLTGILVHSGQGCNNGHYYSYIKGPDKFWYCVDDSTITRVSLKSVLSKSAYILFYTRDENNRNKRPKEKVNQPDRLKSKEEVNQPDKPELNGSTSESKENILKTSPQKNDDQPILNATSNWNVISRPHKSSNDKKQPKSSNTKEPFKKNESEDAHKKIQSRILHQNSTRSLDVPKPSDIGIDFGITEKTPVISTWSHLATSDLVHERQKFLSTLERKRKRPGRDEIEYDKPKVIHIYLSKKNSQLY